MNSADKESVHLIVREYFDQFTQKHLPKILDGHTQACPHGKRVNRLRFIGIGVLIGVACMSTPTLARLIIPLL